MAKQTHTMGTGYGPDWAALEVLTCVSYGDELASKAIVRTKEGATFVDISIEEYTGTTRRAKYTSVRLEEDAARALYEQLRARFGK